MTSTITVTLPDQLRAIVDRAVTSGAYADESDYMRALVRRDQNEEFDLEQRAIISQLLLEGENSGEPVLCDDAFWADLDREIDEELENEKS